MAEPHEPAPAVTWPQVEPIRRRTSLLVWIVPIVAALLGLWLAFKYYASVGPTITISFESANSIEADVTRIRYKQVEIGRVKAVSLSDDHQHAIVTAEMSRNGQSLLRKGARFWVVTPRVGLRGISGLSTLVSGAYINVDPGSGPPARHFEGLEQPPPTPTNTPGIRLQLDAQRASSVRTGSPVYFHEFQVGQVETRHIGSDFNGVQFDLFIKAPYDQLITQDTRFWNASGFNVSLGASGLKINTASLETLLAGGVKFDTPTNLRDGAPAASGAHFTLYADRKTAFESLTAEFLKYVLYFDGSVHGLSTGAPVEYLGIPVGKVIDVRLRYDEKRHMVRAPVTIRLNLDRLTDVPRTVNPTTHIEQLVARGLRGQLQIGNLLSGQLYVDLGLHPDAPAAQITHNDTFPVLPTIPSTINQVANAVSEALGKLKDMPIDGLASKANRLLENLNNLVENAARKNLVGNTAGLVTDLRATTKKLNTLVKGLGPSVATDGPLVYELRRTIRDAGAAARALRDLSETIERDPNSLLFGRQRSDKTQ